MNRRKAKPAGDAETRRLARRADAEAKLKSAQAKLAEAEREHTEATEAFLQQGIGASSVFRDAAKKKMDDMVLYIEHYKSAIAVYDGEDLLNLCEQWDSTPSASADFGKAIQPEAKAAQKAANELVGVIVALRDKFIAANASANELRPVKKELREYGIVVSESRPTLVRAQQAVALALRKALKDAGLSPTEHYVTECLSPRHYDFPVNSPTPPPIEDDDDEEGEAA